MPIFVLPLGINALMLFEIWSVGIPLAVEITLTLLVVLKFVAFFVRALFEEHKVLKKVLIGCCAALNFYSFLVCFANAAICGVICSTTALVMLGIWVLLTAHFQEKEKFNI